ncbi:MAG: type II toxin-antitoxin system VapB family antitoxin [Candidatus Humimicrobiaceae bacterium]
MRTTLEIPEKVIKELLVVTAIKKKSEAVRVALEKFIRRPKLERLLELSEKIEIEDVTVSCNLTKWKALPFTRIKSYKDNLTLL